MDNGQFQAKDYEWNDIIQVFIHILVDSKRKMDEYTVIAQVLYPADFIESCDKPYEDNLAWPLTCDFYELDYCNSTYNVFRDEKKLSILKEFGLIE